MQNLREYSSSRSYVATFGVLLVVVAILWQVITIAFNFFLHPLSRVPGPWLAKVTKFYMIPAIANRQRSHKVLALHERYGPVVRTAPNEVSIADPEAVREVYNNKNSSKSHFFYSSAQFTGPYDNVFSMRDQSAHAARRKLQNPSHSQATVLKNETLISDKVDILIQRVIGAAKSSPSGTTADVFLMAGLFTLEVILKCAFNRNYGVSPSGDSLTIHKAMDGGSAAFAMRVAMPWISLSWGERLPGGAGEAFRQYNLFIRTIRELQTQFYREQLKDDAAEHRFMTTPLFNSTDAYLGRTLTDDEVTEELVSLVFAGSGTTATLLTYLLWCLSLPENEAIQDRLREEVRKTGTSLTEVQHLPVLNAVIQETHRVYPSLIGMLPRTLNRDILVGEYVLPKGTLVAMQNLVHHRNPTVFPGPASWKPDRWLDGRATKQMEAALTPFSVGPRNCIGQNLAKAELYLATSKIMRAMKVTVNEATTVDDMFMEDRGPTFPRGKRCLLDIKVLE